MNWSLKDQEDPRNWVTDASTITQFLTYLKVKLGPELFEVLEDQWYALPKGAAMWVVTRIGRANKDQVMSLDAYAFNFQTAITDATELLAYVSNNPGKEGPLQEDLPSESGQTTRSAEDPQ